MGVLEREKVWWKVTLHLKVLKYSHFVRKLLEYVFIYVIYFIYFTQVRYEGILKSNLVARFKVWVWGLNAKFGGYGGLMKIKLAH